jgi:hypothetical protein
VINEARVVLGHDPLSEAAANRPMVLTPSGYVALGQEAPSKRLPSWIVKDNPYHDERGRFTTADGVGTGADHPAEDRVRVASNDPQMPVEVAQKTPEEENRGLLEEFIDPLAELRGEQWGRAYQTLKALDPNNPQLVYAAPQNWVPTNQNIADINAEIARVAVQRATNFVAPGGNLIGDQGGDVDVRILPGGAKAAQQAFDYLSVGGTPYTGSYSPSGQMFVLPGNTGLVGLRNNDQGIPTVDVNVPSTFGSVRIHYK